jgi:protein SCO1/2
MPRAAAGLLAALLAATMLPAAAHGGKASQRLPVVGRAPDFTLTTHAGAALALADLRDKVLAVTFIYATCRDSCPVLAAKLVGLQRRLGADFGPRVRFVAITVDPETDTPEVLRGYAEAIGADQRGWSFLTGDPAAIRSVVAQFGGFARRGGAGVDHLYLTSIIDRAGAVRVQYTGHRFDPEEMLRDIRSLARE